MVFNLLSWGYVLPWVLVFQPHLVVSVLNYSPALCFLMINTDRSACSLFNYYYFFASWLCTLCFIFGMMWLVLNTIYWMKTCRWFACKRHGTNVIFYPHLYVPYHLTCFKGLPDAQSHVAPLPHPVVLFSLGSRCALRVYLCGFFNETIGIKFSILFRIAPEDFCIL